MTLHAQPVFDQDGRYHGLMVECPGCEFGHHVLPTDWTPPGAVRAPDGERPQWRFDGNLELPTLHPSIRCWADWGPERRRVVCHSFVRAGRIQFLSDCTHALAGMTVDLPEIG